MIKAGLLKRWRKSLDGLRSDESGSNAIEFAILALPLLLLIMFILQVGLYFSTKASLDSGVLMTAESLQGQFASGASPTLPTPTALKASVAQVNALVANSSALAVEVQPLNNLTTAPTPIVDGTANYGAPNTVLVIRARYAPVVIMPIFANSTISASALVRRQAQ